VLAVIGSVSALPIAFTAHVGGFITGVVMTKVLVSLERVKRNELFSIATKNHEGTVLKK
jgi:rhomboid protease GluP